MHSTCWDLRHSLYVIGQVLATIVENSMTVQSTIAFKLEKMVHFFHFNSLIITFCTCRSFFRIFFTTFSDHQLDSVSLDCCHIACSCNWLKALFEIVIYTCTRGLNVIQHGGHWCVKLKLIPISSKPLKGLKLPCDEILEEYIYDYKTFWSMSFWLWLNSVCTVSFQYQYKCGKGLWLYGLKSKDMNIGTKFTYILSNGGLFKLMCWD